MTAHLTKYSGQLGVSGTGAAPWLNAVGRTNEGYTTNSTQAFRYFTMNTENTSATIMAWGYRLSSGQWRQSGFRIDHNGSPTAWQTGSGNVDVTDANNTYRMGVNGGVNQVTIHRASGTTSYGIMVQNGANYHGGVS